MTENASNETDLAAMVSQTGPFLEPLEDPTSDNSMAYFIEEYSKLQEALKKSHESETRFVTKCRTLMQSTEEAKRSKVEVEQEAESQTRKRQALETQRKTVKDSKIELRKEIERHTAQLSKIREEIKQLEYETDHFAETLHDEHERRINELEVNHTKLLQQRNRDRSQLSLLRQENMQLYYEVEKAERKVRQEREETDELDARVAQLDATCAEQERNKDTIDEEMNALKEECEERTRQLDAKRTLVKRAREELERDKTSHKQTLRHLSVDRDKLSTINDQAVANEDLFQTQRDVADTNHLKCESLKKGVKEDTTKLQQAEKQTRKLTKLLEKLKTKIGRVEKEYHETEAVKEQRMHDLESLRAEIASKRSQIAVLARQIDVSVREREVLSHDYIRKNESVAANANLLVLRESAARTLEAELKSYAQASRQWKAVIEQLVQDTDAYKDELERRKLSKARVVEKGAKKDGQILSFQRDIASAQIRVRQQQTMLEALRSDRNSYSKQLSEQKGNMTEYSHAFSSLQHTISRVQNELNDKESAFVHEHLRVEQVDDEIKAIRHKIRTQQTRGERVRQRAQALVLQAHRLETLLGEADDERVAQLKQYNASLNEQRMLSQQLVKRNEELGELYESLRLQEAMLKMGEDAYRKKKKKVKVLEKSKQDVQLEFDSISYDTEELGQLKHTIIRLDQQITKFQLKQTALELELETPMNVHRWRALQDTDAEAFSMLTKVHALQKEVISRADAVKQKDQDIRLEEKLYVDLRRVLARQPGAEAAEQLRLFEATVKEKKSKLKGLNAELRLNQARVHELRYECERVHQDIDLIKLSYFEKKRNEEQQAQKRQGDSSNQPFYAIRNDQGLMEEEPHLTPGEYDKSNITIVHEKESPEGNHDMSFSGKLQSIDHEHVGEIESEKLE